RWTLTSFGFALTLPTDVGCFKFSARPFVRAHPHFAQVRAWHPDHRLMLPVRARTLTSFGFALTLRPDVKRFKFSVRCFVRTPFVSAQFAPGTLTAFRVRAGYSGRAFDASSSRPILCEGALWGRCECPVRARSFERGPSLRSGPGLTFLTWLNASSPGTNPHYVRIRVNVPARR